MENILFKKSYLLSNFKEIKYNDLWNKKGIFTTIRVIGRPYCLYLFDQHLKNLNYSLKKFGINTSLSKRKICKIINNLFNKKTTYDHLFRIAINSNILSVSLRVRPKPKKKFFASIVSYRRPDYKYKNLNKKIIFKNFPSLEAQISSISDDIAYNNHDIQDGMKANLFKLKDLIEINFFKEIYLSHKKNINKNNDNILIYQIIRDSIDLMVKDLIKNTIHNLKKSKINNIQNVYNSSNQIVCFSNKLKNIEKEIRLFLRQKMYNNKNIIIKNNKGKKIVKKLYNLISKKPYKFLNKQRLKENKTRAIADFISGMTDRYAINLYNSAK